jgi:hypothetical protein
MPPVEYAHNYFLLMQRLEELYKSPVDLMEIEMIDNPYIKVILYGDT